MPTLTRDCRNVLISCQLHTTITLTIGQTAVREKKGRREKEEEEKESNSRIRERKEWSGNGNGECVGRMQGQAGCECAREGKVNGPCSRESWDR